MVFALPLIAIAALFSIGSAVDKGVVPPESGTQIFWAVIAILGLTGLGSIATTLSESKDLLERLADKSAPEKEE